MWTANGLTCMVQGHVYRRIRHDNSLYHYCLRCGKMVWEHSHVTSLRQHMHRVVEGIDTVATVQDKVQVA